MTRPNPGAPTRRRLRAPARDRGASDVVGTLVLVAITLVLTVALVVLVFDAMATDEPVHLNVRTHATATSLDVEHMGGDALPTTNVYLRIAFSDGTEEQRWLSDFLASGDDGTWAVGERVCITGTSSRCQVDYQGKTLEEVRVVVAPPSGEARLQSAWTGTVTGQTPV